MLKYSEKFFDLVLFFSQFFEIILSSRPETIPFNDFLLQNCIQHHEHAGNVDLPKSSHSTPTTFVLQEKFENFSLWGSKSVHFHEKLIDILQAKLHND